MPQAQQQQVPPVVADREDEESFEVMFRTYYEDLCKLAFYYVKDTSIAENLVQDVFLNVWKMREGRSDIECLKAYLCRSVRNMALKYLDRQRTAQQWAEQEKHSASLVFDRADELLRYHELEREIKKNLEALPERRRQIFMLSRYQNLTYEEIANVLEISVKTVETQMMRSLKLLRERLGPYLVTTA